MQAAIVTGADHGYFPLMHALLKTLDPEHLDPACRLLVLDFGLTSDQRAAALALADEVVRPDWWFDAPDKLRIPRNLGYAARPMIPEYFPGYDIYLWLDADISVQNGQFARDFLHSAKEGSLAIVEEADPSYRTELYALKWRVGNAFRCFGAVDGLRLCLGRQINSGAFALRADAARPACPSTLSHPAPSAFNFTDADNAAFRRILSDGDLERGAAPEAETELTSRRDRDVGPMRIVDFDKEHARARETRHRANPNIKIRYFD